MGVHQREGGVVADRADVAEMVGEALELGHQRAQPDGARRRLDAERGLDGAREGQRVGDRAVARDAAGELRRRARAARRHQRLDALVDVAQPLLEAHHGLAVGGEAEMAGLDDAGMHRADRDLVQALAFGRQERRRRGRTAPASRCGPSGWRTPQRPWSSQGRGSGSAVRLEPEQVADGALEADRGRMRPADRGKAPSGHSQADHADLARRCRRAAPCGRRRPSPHRPSRRRRARPRAAGARRRARPSGVDDDARPRPVARRRGASP